MNNKDNLLSINIGSLTDHICSQDDAARLFYSFLVSGDLSSVDKIYKQFGPRSLLTKRFVFVFFVFLKMLILITVSR